MARDPDVTEAVPAKDDSVLSVRAANLEVTAGPDRGRCVRVDRPTFVVGKGEGADLRLSDTTVSREHLRVSLTPTGIQLRDEDSKNGVWIGGLRVYEAVLTADAAIELGATTIAIQIESGPLELPLSQRSRFGAAIGESAALRHVFSILERAAASDVSVLLEGESGVGKGVLARAVHAHSARAEGPFVAVNCGAIPAGLIEAELFGAERGAFTGAGDSRAGVFEQADKGTLFLDEIGELPTELQPKLLRVLDDGELRRLGGGAPMTVNVRVVAATNRRMSEAVHAGEFRSDLFYRLAVARVVVPPLRDRPEDIAPLSRALLRDTLADEDAELPADFASMLAAYRWPGNVRELRNVIERYALLGMRDTASLFDASHSSAGPDELSLLPYTEARKRAIEAFERDYFPKVLARADGVVARAAELADVKRPSFYRMLARIRGEDDPQ